VKLLVHSIPASLASPQLPIIHALGKAGAPPPAAVEAGSGPGQLLLVFSNAAVAEAAFSALPGPRGADSVGRPQKELQLAGGFRVRGRGVRFCMRATLQVTLRAAGGTLGLLRLCS
jgi:hypothetical protein